MEARVLISPEAIRFRRACPEALESLLARDDTLTPLVAEMLIARGLRSPDEVHRFFNPSPEALHDPFLLKDMDLAVEVLKRALSGGERILVQGDYDCDGICGTTLLVEALQEMGADVSYHVPDRFKEGYGLSMLAVERCRDEGFGLLISVDCGSSSVVEVAQAKALGVKVIITDHHSVPSEAPVADAFVNPQRPDCTYPFKGICGTAVAFKLVQALRDERGANPAHFMDLVALATVADVVPLVDENRVLVQLGLQELGRSRREGIIALLEISGHSDRDVVDAGTVGFTIGPRLNAAGRLEHARLGVELMLSRSLDESRKLATHLDSLNEARKECEKAIQDEIEARLKADPSRYLKGAIVEWGEGWHEGVVGITAGRLSERYGVPVLVIAKNGEQAKGSGRSRENVDLYQALCQCSDVFSKFGGHPRAGGFSLPAERLEELSELMVEAANSLREGAAPLWVDGCLTLSQVDLGLVKELERMEPFGEANPRPTFLLEGVDIAHQRIVGKGGDHLQLEIEQVGQRRKAIAFRQAGLVDVLQTQKYRYDIRCQLGRNVFRGQEQLKIQVSGVVRPPCATTSSEKEESRIVDLRHLRGRRQVVDQWLGSDGGLVAICRVPTKAVEAYPEHDGQFFEYETCPTGVNGLLLLTPPPSVACFRRLMEKVMPEVVIILFGSHEIERALAQELKRRWNRETAISLWQLLRGMGQAETPLRNLLQQAQQRIRLSHEISLEIVDAFLETEALTKDDDLLVFGQANGIRIEDTQVFGRRYHQFNELMRVRTFFSGPDLAGRLAKEFPFLAPREMIAGTLRGTP